MDIFDYKGNGIGYEFEADNSSGLVVFYPGLSYTLKAPLFFYLQRLFRYKGFDTIGIDFRYKENDVFMNTADEEQDIWFEYDSKAIGKEIMELSKSYDRVVYVGKSLGTTMLMNQLKNGLIDERADLVYLTPGTAAKEICSTIKRTKNRTLVAYGNADKCYSKENIDLIRERKDILIIEIENAGHNFEVTGDIRQSISNLTEVIEAVDKFIG